MSIFSFLCFCSFFCISLSHTCTTFDKRNFLNTQSNLNWLNEVLEPLKQLFPVYNNITIPNYGEIIEQYQKGKANDDVYLNFTQLVTKYGFAVERHQVVTEDRYCLTMYRIPKPGAPVVLLMHGLMSSSDDWITVGLRVALAYALALAGFDVWLGNARGNKHSRCNLDLSPDCGEFWDFSYNEMGRYDIPAMIDYTLERTGKCKLAYVGHSEGTTVFFVMASERPEYNDKISIMICLSAVVFMNHVRNPSIRLGALFVDLGSALADLIGVYELIPRDVLTNFITSTFCGSPVIAEIFCQFPIYIGSGFNFPQLNATVLPVVFGHYTAGASVKSFLHYGQAAKLKKFANYDYGAEQNLIKYGTFEPPDYPLEKVICPVSIFYSHHDWATSASDIFKLVNILPNVVELFHVPCASFQHFDYLLAKDNDILINKEVIRLLKEYNKEDDNDDL